MSENVWIRFRVALFAMGLGLMVASGVVGLPSGSAGAGCAELPTLAKDVVADVDCVEAALVSGIDVYEDIAAVCVPLEVGQIVEIVEAKANPPDAGAPEASSVADARAAIVTRARRVHHRKDSGPSEAGE